MAVVFKNNAKTTLSAGITSSATSITVTDGSVFPSLSGGDVFFLTLDDLTNNEIVKCTNRSTDTLTIVRAQDGTTARSFSAGDRIEMRVVAALVNDLFTQASGGGGQRTEWYGFYINGDDLNIDYTASGSTDNYVDSDYPVTKFVPSDIQISINASGHLILTTS